jgi:hypothetical protein
MGYKMRPGSFMEKRRFERLDLALPVGLKRALPDGREEVINGVTLDVSYNGAYISEVDPRNLKPEDDLRISLSVPRDNTRDFPFSRLIGKVTVKRIEKDGIALEFSDDISRLFVAV